MHPARDWKRSGSGKFRRIRKLEDAERMLDRLKPPEGGMGVVYKPRDTHLSRFVAIKLLRPEKAGENDRIQRFIHEARTASALNHPHIVTIHEISTHNGAPFIVMEYLPRKTLDRLIPGKCMRLSEVVKIGSQVAGALGLGCSSWCDSPGREAGQRGGNGRRAGKSAGFRVGQAVGARGFVRTNHRDHCRRRRAAAFAERRRSGHGLLHVSTGAISRIICDPHTPRKYTSSV